MLHGTGISVIGLTIAELLSGKVISDSLDDPNAYLPNDLSGWIEMVSDNPHASTEDLALILALDANVIVGKLAMIAGGAPPGSETARTFMLSSFSLNADYRDTGVGGMMLLRAIGNSKSLVASGRPSEDATLLYKHVGFEEIGPLDRYVYFYSTTAITRRLGSLNRMMRPTAPLLDRALAGYYRLRRPRSKGEIEFRQVESLGEDINALLEKSPFRRFDRNTKVINWAYRHQPSAWLFEIWKGAEIKGFALLQPREVASGSGPDPSSTLKMGSLLDFYVGDADRDDLLELVDYCVRFFEQRDVDIFECQSNSPKLHSVCASFGMIRRTGNRVLVRALGDGPSATPNGWNLTQAEGDVIISNTG